ncbi:MAG TPA: aspartyl protease family protein [Methylomirabilota bacterium]|jgi:predicted aspartyl protease|nr:aspartyl protease family protein [Methylomirabilota bacterium]
MGTFRTVIEIGDPTATVWEPLEALVDTGASFTLVPTPLLARLGVVAHAREEFELADGRVVNLDVGRTWVRAEGRAEQTLVVFAPEDAAPLLGAYTLEGLRLAADPVARRLVPVRGLLLAI